jgi:hypothetical protein
MNFRDVALTIFWRPPASLQGATSFAVAGSTLGFALGVLWFQEGPHSWLCIPAALIGDFAGAGLYLALRSAGLLRSSAPKESG